MLTNIDKAQLLRDALELLHEADALVQQALGAGDNCYEVHCEIEDLAETLEGFAEQLVEMQVAQ